MLMDDRTKGLVMHRWIGQRNGQGCRCR
jgi:hypothetical protein